MLNEEFSNPLLPAPSQDPWVTFEDGVFFGLITDGQRIFLRRSVDVFDLFRQPAMVVWHAPPRGGNAKHLWAPELHRLGGHWFIYYAADNGRNQNHRLWVLGSVGDDPGGPYRCLGMLDTGGDWAIDATVFRRETEGLFMIWSGWAGKEKGAQNLYIASMSDPVTLSSSRVLLTGPDEPWEQRGGAAICEGPAVLQRDGTTCIVYSASASWTTQSCLGMLVHRAGSLLDPGGWIKKGPVFSRTKSAWGIGHCSLVSLPCEAGLIFYHAKTRRTRGWRDRNVCAQRFAWDLAGLPIFGIPSD